MDEKALAAYLDRITVMHPGILDAAALRVLHRAHQLAVPFENLSIHLSEPISLAAGDLIDKIVTRRRGGFCYELNGAFALLLEALAADLTRIPLRHCRDLPAAHRRRQGLHPRPHPDPDQRRLRRRTAPAIRR